ncbi:hypothetical protein AB4571_02625 [Vibrio breoganii]|uniref:hypothetical protein n=2 Tax=Vibrio TaxID=662 RepID=UPI000C867EA5|nr:hypothetical protein [Vibrio breoganii]PML12806.1 hypothetical protein BCT84_02670 [Vibrio breoganii]
MRVELEVLFGELRVFPREVRESLEQNMYFLTDAIEVHLVALGYAARTLGLQTERGYQFFLEYSGGELGETRYFGSHGVSTIMPAYGDAVFSECEVPEVFWDRQILLNEMVEQKETEEEFESSLRPYVSGVLAQLKPILR